MGEGLASWVEWFCVENLYEGLMMEHHVVMFSGGKDSTAMLLLMLEKGMRVDHILFVDTTKEFPQMYEHIRRVQDMIKPRVITHVSFDFDYWFSVHKKTRGKNKGDVGYGWPFLCTRWCTALKRAEGKRFLSTLTGKVIEYHGIAFDELHRCEKNDGRIIKYPLVQWGMDERDALEFCYKSGLTWGGLYEKFSRVSCFCCPLKKIKDFRVLWKDFPEMWEEIEGMDSMQGRRFRADYSVKELSFRFLWEEIIGGRIVHRR